MSKAVADREALLRVHRSRRSSIYIRIKRFAVVNPAGAIAAAVLAIIALMVVLAPFLTPFALDTFVARPLQPVMSETITGQRLWLGSDELGRDLLTRLLYGGRVSLFVGLAAALIGVSVGTFLGIISAYFGGKVDLFMQRLVDTLVVLPGLILAMAITIALGFTVTVVILALAVNNLAGSVRIVRSRVLSLKELQYVDSARAIGATDWHIMLKHLSPNTLTVSFVLITVTVGTAITVEAALSFLGIGITPPTPSWGNMLTNAQAYSSIAPHIAIAPGLIIAVVVLCVNLLGDTLRDILDPRLKGR